MNIAQIFSKDLLDEMLTEGYVRAQQHPSLPLTILNYTEKTQFAGRWNACTLACRGLIVDDSGNVIARPFAKFFNMGDSHAADIDWDSPVEVTDKLDGSMGIFYSFGVDHQAIATRGSFASEQAQHATNLWNERYRHITTVPNFFTPIFEIVYKENRIVLDYGDMDDLILLGGVFNEWGYVYGPRQAAAMIDWPGPKAKIFDYETIHDAVAAPYRANAEGLVIRSGSKMLKIKQADYVELHRLISMLSERSVWSQLKDGKIIEEICEALPDEFHGFVKEAGAELLEQFEWIYDEAVSKYSMLIGNLPVGFTRREFALKANAVDVYRAHMFMLLDGKPLDELVWKQIRPDVNKE